MSGVNKAILIGHLGADPEIKQTRDTGKPVATFSLATSESWRDKESGERKERTQWHRIVIFNEGLCKIAEQYLKKGSKVYVEGAIETRKWTAQDGAERYTTEIVLRGFHASLQMLDRAERPAPSEEDYGTTTTRSSSSGARPSSKDELDDEIPF